MSFNSGHGGGQVPNNFGIGPSPGGQSNGMGMQMMENIEGVQNFGGMQGPVGMEGLVDQLPPEYAGLANLSEPDRSAALAAIVGPEGMQQIQQQMGGLQMFGGQQGGRGIGSQGPAAGMGMTGQPGGMVNPMSPDMSYMNQNGGRPTGQSGVGGYGGGSAYNTPQNFVGQRPSLSQQYGAGSQRFPGNFAESQSQLPIQGGGGSRGAESGSQDPAQQLMAYVRATAASCTDSIAQGMNTILVLDTSASMRGEPIQLAKNQVELLLAGIEDNAMENGLEENLAMITFGKETRVIQHLTNDYSRIRDAMDGLSPAGSSCVVDSLVMTLGMNERGGSMYLGKHIVPCRIIIISDGQLTEISHSDSFNDVCHPEQKYQLIETVSHLIKQVVDASGIQISVVPVGSLRGTVMEGVLQTAAGMVFLMEDMKWLSRHYLHHVIVGYILSETHGKIPEKSVLSDLAKAKCAGIEDRDIDAVLELLQHPQTPQGAGGASGGPTPQNSKSKPPGSLPAGLFDVDGGDTSNPSQTSQNSAAKQIPVNTGIPSQGSDTEARSTAVETPAPPVSQLDNISSIIQSQQPSTSHFESSQVNGQSGSTADIDQSGSTGVTSQASSSGVTGQSNSTDAIGENGFMEDAESPEDMESDILGIDTEPGVPSSYRWPQRHRPVEEMDNAEAEIILRRFLPETRRGVVNQALMDQLKREAEIADKEGKEAPRPWESPSLREILLIRKDGSKILEDIDGNILGDDEEAVMRRNERETQRKLQKEIGIPYDSDIPLPLCLDDEDLEDLTEERVNELLDEFGGGPPKIDNLPVMPAIGLRVKPGPDWMWKCNGIDIKDKGTVVGIDPTDKGWIRVEWDKDGKEEDYRWGLDYEFDVEPLEGGMDRVEWAEGKERIIKTTQDIADEFGPKQVKQKLRDAIMRTRRKREEDEARGIHHEPSYSTIASIARLSHKKRLQKAKEIKRREIAKSEARKAAAASENSKASTSTATTGITTVPSETASNITSTSVTTTVTTTGAAATTTTTKTEPANATETTENISATKPTGNVDAMTKTTGAAAAKASPKQSEGCFVWQYMDDQGEWKNYSPDVQKQLEETYLKRGEKGTVIVNINEEFERVVFQSMEQRNNNNKKKTRKVQRIEKLE